MNTSRCWTVPTLGFHSVLTFDSLICSPFLCLDSFPSVLHSVNPWPVHSLKESSWLSIATSAVLLAIHQFIFRLCPPAYLTVPYNSHNLNMSTSVLHYYLKTCSRWNSQLSPTARFPGDGEALTVLCELPALGKHSCSPEAHSHNTGIILSTPSAITHHTHSTTKVLDNLPNTAKEVIRKNPWETITIFFLQRHTWQENTISYC